MPEYICAGFGGQGVLKAGFILADTGMRQNKNVTWFPSYGAEMRGGTANCHVKISDGDIASPYANEPDILVAMNQASIDKLEKTIRTGGWLLYNSSLVNSGHVFRSDIHTAKIDATNIAAEMGHVKGTNIVMLGALAKFDDTLNPEDLKENVDLYFREKGKYHPKNARCFEEGMKCVVTDQKMIKTGD